VTSDDAHARFSRMYEACYWSVLGYARRRIPDEDTARDAAAEVFAVAWRRWDHVPASDPLPWLYRVAGDVVGNERRRQGRVQDLTRQLAELLPSPDQEGVAADRGRLMETLEVLSQLSTADQEVLRLHAWEGLSGAALAEALGCSTTAAAVRLHRARRRLQRGMLESRLDVPAQPASQPAR
jgi:RNA polymerase sigma-70 factor, ECF subfamily